MVVEDVYKDKLDRSEYCLLLHEIKPYFINHNNYAVVFSKRQTNNSAHVLAHTYRSYFNVIPYCIATICMNVVMLNF